MEILHIVDILGVDILAQYWVDILGVDILAQ